MVVKLLPGEMHYQLKSFMNIFQCITRKDEHNGVLLLQLLQGILHFVGGDRIQAGGWFIQQEHFRFQCQAALSVTIIKVMFSPIEKWA